MKRKQQSVSRTDAETTYRQPPRQQAVSTLPRPPRVASGASGRARAARALLPQQLTSVESPPDEEVSAPGVPLDDIPAAEGPPDLPGADEQFGP